ncbi:zinc finger Y-chromosomal protein 1-like isoform X2 [Coccinella septempunctata]|uniref:zinc finger Y-chromosomal protein 1-like isoform X2 n=1 Tax=Coccinella septempunctata TaxID=41139 RepID=UPI001D0922DA|nr:zinc finger Y-chromosomal protein 1-like isoform X2 [Coccinella septempunctata]
MLIDDLKTKLTPDIIDEYQRRQNKQYSRIFEKIKLININKMRKLEDLNKHKHFKTQDKWLKNLTRTTLPEDVKTMLALGPKFSVPVSANQTPIYRLITDIEDLIQKIPNERRDLLRAQITSITTNFIYRNQNKNYISEKLYNTTKNFLKLNNELIILNSDKGSVTVVMERSDYTQKMLSIINSDEFSEIHRDPTPSIQTKSNGFISMLLTHKVINREKAKSMKVYNSTAPKIYGNPKIHKDGVPLRPIVSCIQSPTRHLSEFIVDILKSAYDKGGKMDRDERSIDVKEEVHIIPDEVKFEEKLEVFEQFIDGNGVYGREKYIIKNEEINSNSLVVEGDSNQSSVSFTEEMFPVLHSPGNKSEPEYHLVDYPACEEKYVDKHIQYDHTSSSIDDKKRQTKLGVVDIFEQFIDKERVHDREEYIIKNEGSNSNSLVIEGDANPLNIKNHKCASFKGQKPQVLDSLMNNSETVHLEENECNNSCPSSEKHDLGTRIQCGSSSKNRNKKKVKSIHSNIKNHKCDLCDYVANRKWDLENHTNSVHLNIKKHECHLCDYVTSRNWDLQKHVNGVHLNIRKHKCHLCEFAASSKTVLDNHVKSVHLNIKDHKCNLCEFPSYENQKLDVPIKCVHLKIKENKCHLCDYDTSTKGSLRKHIESVHMRIKNHKCNLCEFAASTKSILDSHVKSVHLKIKDNRCHLCEYVACRKDTLQNHIDFVHLNIKKYKCDLCEYAASVKKCLVAHVKTTHLKIKEHKCHLCDYDTERKGSLQRHIDSVHLKLKQHQCHLCDYAASVKDGLRYHINSVHLKINEHKCDTCEYVTNSKSTLQKHIECVHLKKHKCHLCEYTANMKTKLNKHIKTVHSKK